MATRFFRAGVGIVLYTKNNTVAIFRNNAWEDATRWELPQGGIEDQENPEDTLWRELHEEVGLLKNDVTLKAEFPRWLIYQHQNTASNATELRLGQAHKWYFLELKESTFIDLDDATDKEFTDFKLVDWSTAAASIGVARRPVYLKLKRYYEENIRK
jgi:putative (di)nucleoside polyphosphate hydrolase